MKAGQSQNQKFNKFKHHQKSQVAPPPPQNNQQLAKFKSMLDEKEWENNLDDSESKITGLTSLVEKNKSVVKSVDDRNTATSADQKIL